MRDNHPRIRQARKLKRKQGNRPPYDRVLIVSEGGKTEPLYFEAIRQTNRVPAAHVTVLPSALGTECRQVVDFAEETFLDTKAYEHVYAVFDRDQHLTYNEALGRAAALNGRYRSEAGKPVRFIAVPSVPCFELWLLLHFEQIHAFGHRDEIVARLKHHIPHYEKGAQGIYQRTKQHFPIAAERARRLRQHFTAETGTDPFTCVDELMDLLDKIRVERP